MFDRDKKVVNLIRQNCILLFALELTKDGYTRHPLYVKANKIPELYQ